MKYVKAFYENEMVKTNDVICTSPYSVAHKQQNIGTEENPEYVTVTEVTVDAGRLF